MIRRIVVVIALSVAVVGSVLVDARPAAAAPQLWDLRTAAWDAYLDRSGSTAAARTNTLVLNQLFATVTPGSWVVLPADAVYTTDDTIRIPTDGVVVSGSATIRALNEARSAVDILADGVQVVGLEVRGSATTRDRRRSTPESAGFAVRGVGTVLTDVQVRDVAGAGIMMLGAVLFQLTRPSIVNSQADGIHMTSGSSYGLVQGASVTDSGDDGIAVVSYRSNPAPTAYITVENAVVTMSPAPPMWPTSYAWGRAYTVSGGAWITFRNIWSHNSAAAGVYLAAEPPTSWNTRGVHDIEVDGAVLIGSNRDATSCADPNQGCVIHGAVVVWNTQADPAEAVRDITLRNVVIIDTDANATRQVAIISANGGVVSDVLLRDFTFTGGPSLKLWPSYVAGSAYSTVCWKADGQTLPNHIGFPVPPPGAVCSAPGG